MDRTVNRIIIISFSIFLLAFMMGSKDLSGAEPPEEFFRGKTVSLVVAMDVGGTTDLMARIIAPILGKEINAKVRVENKRTDEGINYIFNQAPRDGLVLGMKDSDSIVGNDILKAPGAKYEIDKLNFVSDIYPAVKMFMMSPKIPNKTLDALRQAKGLRAGGTSAKGSLAMSSGLMIEILGLDAKIITGFKGSKGVVLGVGRGELDFIVPRDSTAVNSERDGYGVNLFTLGDKRSIVGPHVPTLSELGVKVSKELTPAYKFITSSGQSVVLPPGVPVERIDYLRKAFQNISNNQELKKGMEKLTGASMPFASGKDVQKNIMEIKADKELAAKIDAIFKKYTAVR